MGAIPKPKNDTERLKRTKKRKTARKKKSKLQKKKDNPNSTLWKRKADAAWGELQHLRHKKCIVGQANDFTENFNLKKMSLDFNIKALAINLYKKIGYKKTDYIKMEKEI